MLLTSQATSILEARMSLVLWTCVRSETGRRAGVPARLTIASEIMLASKNSWMKFDANGDVIAIRTTFESHICRLRSEVAVRSWKTWSFHDLAVWRCFSSLEFPRSLEWALSLCSWNFCVGSTRWGKFQWSLLASRYQVTCEYLNQFTFHLWATLSGIMYRSPAARHNLQESVTSSWQHLWVSGIEVTDSWRLVSSVQRN